MLDGLEKTENTHRGKIPDLMKERNALSKARDKKYSEIRKLREDFKKNNNEWYAYKKVMTARKKLEQEEEKKRREKEKAEWLAEKVRRGEDLCTLIFHLQPFSFLAASLAGGRGT